MAEHAQQRPRRGVVVGLDTLDLDRAVEPGDRVDALPTIYLAAAKPVAGPMTNSRDCKPVVPAAFEMLLTLRPPEAERWQLPDAGDLRGKCHRAAPSGKLPMHVSSRSTSWIQPVSSVAVGASS